jgi:hypothetical protein
MTIKMSCALCANEHLVYILHAFCICFVYRLQKPEKEKTHPQIFSPLIITAAQTVLKPFLPIS